jgi:multidrug efflux pump subunit AcrA (membrane-fusion protein)
LLARIREASGIVLEVRSPLPGKIETIASRDGARVGAGAAVLTISSDVNSLWEVLRALALTGKTDDLKEIDRYARGVNSVPDRIKEQAALTMKAIRSRAAQKGETGGNDRNGPSGQKLTQ